ncbi:MAG TPA: DUF2087 domain-containing protein [Devosia sp.]|nr:DUF2087 domain-containing protein [Devosia sp.]
MPRTQIAYAAPDLSALARSLRDQLTRLGQTPSHVQMLNMLARAAGHANFQALRAGTIPRATEAALPPADEKRALRAAGYFGADGRLKSWPARTNLQALCLWVFWSRLPRGTSFSEIGISELLDGWHDFGDRALLRREMVDHRLVQRTPNGSDYRRIEQKPPAELAVMLAAIGRAR